MRFLRRAAGSLLLVVFAIAAPASAQAQEQPPTGAGKPPSRPIEDAAKGDAGQAPGAAQAEAQELDLFNRRIPPYVVDLRALMIKVPKNDALAAPYGLGGAALPGLGLGLEAGVHVYPLRRKNWALGLGVAGQWGRAGSSTERDDEGNVTGADVTFKFRAISPQLSVNFGSAAGWSYISGGLAFSNLSLDTPATMETLTVPKRKTINYGGGGRWFFRDRLAFTVDLRFYAVNPVAAEVGVLPSPRVTMMVFSAGVAFR